MSKWKRKQVFVDKKVQTALLWRCFMHWVVCVTVIATIVVAFEILTTPTRLTAEIFLSRIRPPLVGALLLLPILLTDIIFMSNRFVGPLWRLRWGLRKLAAGEHVQQLSFRKRDFWSEVAEEFNAVATRLEQLQSATTTDTQPPEQVEATV